MSDQPWWQRGAIYQIYPRSFADSDGDGVGDLRGIEAHLDHLADLHVEAAWLSPIYRSPMADFGYDVAGYCDVDPPFGTLADLDRLIESCHARGIRLVLDWVRNHTSDQHPWFIESRSSRDILAAELRRPPGFEGYMHIALVGQLHGNGGALGASENNVAVREATYGYHAAEPRQ